MNLIGKVAPIRQQIENKLEYGIDTVELQLLAGFDVEETIRILEDYPQLHVKFVHTPLLRDVLIPDVSLSHLSNLISKDNFMRTCEIASSIYDRVGYPIGVIIHSVESSADWDLKPVLFDAVVNVLKEANKKYEGIFFCIENTTPIAETYGLVNGVTPADLFETCTRLHRSGITNAFITFDICHWIMTKNLFSKTFKDTEYLDTDWLPNISLDEWFHLCGEYIKSIHVASCIGDGVVTEHHGSCITTKDIPLLKKIRSLCYKYLVNPTWTIEVREDDYSNCVNQLKSINICKDILGTDCFP